MYANLDDINAHLPTDKIRATEASANLLELDADRIIRGQVGGVVGIEELQTWVAPESTPEIIRAIAGRLIAAAIYAKAVSEQTDLVPQYAQRLYNDAMSELQRIRTGQTVIVNVDGISLELNTLNFTTDYFYPNEDPPEPTFRVGQLFS